jgi:drug/metabolite transporter (DMT)-like permease
MLKNTASNPETLAKIACTAAGALWGLYWIPLRAVNEAGIRGSWATALFYLAPFVIMLPFGLLRWRRILTAGWPLQCIGITAALALVFYSNAFLYTDVIRAVLLYYLTPIWSALLARVWLKEAITQERIIAIGLGVAGLYIILNSGSGFPAPQNAGDWMGLISGLIWALTANVMRRESRQYTFDVLLMWFFWASVFALVVALMPVLDRPAVPQTRSIINVLPWFIPVVLLMIIPGFYAITWGVPLLNPGTVGILFMTEISTGAFSAAVLTDEPFGTREIVGVGLITAAGLTETVVPRFRQMIRSSLGGGTPPP